ncbi:MULTISPECIES: lipase/acyltransferase domain-containing protein [Paraburkholderia]|uniref:GPI inositol-deacylase PGAP1-like alpha/beta domain-containing protein n=2 Tax=Paraburkholderia TaxID=1822464 RepID=A0ABU9RUB0_9BURK
MIFVPGVMGTNLKAVKGPKANKPVWLVNSKGSVGADWFLRGPEKRKLELDPANTDVYQDGEIPTGTAQGAAELHRRGWGTVAKMSYGTFLPFLENTLNDAHECKGGFRAALMKELVAEAPGVSVLSHDEVALSYMYYMPVHAVGYNWLQSNSDSAKYLAAKIAKITDYYKDQGKVCEKVIIVTHSMGGFVARHYSEVDGHRDKVLGIVHGVMPTTGSATAYKRVTSGTEGEFSLRETLGGDRANMTAVFAQAPGPLQLLPSVEYGMGWLKIRDGASLFTLPESDPYEQIYLQRGKWWGLVDDTLINPLDPKKTSIDADWTGYQQLINTKVKPFHEAMRGKFHPATYAFYGDDEKHRTWGDVVWKRAASPQGAFGKQNDPITDLLDRKLLNDDGTGTQYIDNMTGPYHVREKFALQDAAENGDGTVPIRSGRAPAGQSGVQACVAYPDVDHEGAYKNRPQQLFALWAITRIVGNVKGTLLEYKC